MKTATKPKVTVKEEASAACAVPCFNLELVQEIKESLPAEEEVRTVTALYSALADPTRLKVLLALSRGELCVCDVSHVIGLSVSATSHQLRVLRNLALVSYRNDGKMAYYSLPEESPVFALINEVYKDCSIVRQR